MRADQRAVRVLPSRARQRFPRSRRIAERAEFELLFGSPRVGNRWFVVHCRKTVGNCSRLGLVVSKRVEPKAHARNHVKRMIREEFRRVVPEDSPVNMIVRLRRGLQGADNGDLRGGLGQLLREVKDATIVD